MQMTINETFFKAEDNGTEQNEERLSYKLEWLLWPTAGQKKSMNGGSLPSIVLNML